MPKTAIDPAPLRLTGPTMGTVWEVVIDAALTNVEPVQRDLQAAVAEVDAQMSTWSPDSALMRFNAAPCDQWIALPDHLLSVLEAGLRISAATGNAFEMNVGAAVRAWGFGAAAIDLDAIRAASAAPRIAASEALSIDRAAGVARKSAPLSLDLSGIAKGYGVDRLAETVMAQGITHALCSIDGELRAIGPRADGRPWSVGIDAPDDLRRGQHSLIALQDGAVATSGDYRHFVTLRDKRLSHTINPATRAPMVDAPASVTVLAGSCRDADALATALTVMGQARAKTFADAQGLSTLILAADGTATGTGVFA